MPKVSVIIPVYGVEKYIERCARSLFEQTLDDIEYLFIDDCTPDKSIEILKNVLDEYPNRKNQVIIHRMEQNSGQAIVRKWGMQNAAGDYVIHCDSDDWVDTDMYLALYEQAMEGNFDMVACDYYLSDGLNHRYVKELIPNNTTDLFRSVLTKKTHSAVWNKLVKRDLYNKDNFLFPAGNNAEDHLILSQLSYYSQSISFVNKPLYYYCYNPQSITHITNIDWIVSRFEQGYSNKKLLKYFLQAENVFNLYRDEYDLSVVTSKFLLFPYLKYKRIKSLWRSSYPEVFPRLLFNNGLTRNAKIKYIIAQIRTLFV